MHILLYDSEDKVMECMCVHVFHSKFSGIVLSYWFL
jgi:hypothetical protein